MSVVQRAQDDPQSRCANEVIGIYDITLKEWLTYIKVIDSLSLRAERETLDKFVVTARIALPSIAYHN